MAGEISNWFEYAKQWNAKNIPLKSIQEDQVGLADPNDKRNT